MDTTDLTAKICFLYFEDEFRKDPGKIDGQLQLTPFHTALVRGNWTLVTQVLQLTKDDVKLQHFVLNTPCVMLHNLSDTKVLVCPAYLEQVTDKLSEEEKRCLQGDGLEPRGKKLGLLTPSLVRTHCLLLPLSLAAMSGDDKLLTYMLQQGADLLSVDTNGNNIIHHHVELSTTLPQRAVHSYNHLMSCVEEHSKKDVLAMKNKEGRRPLDLAGKLGLTEMLLAIIRTKGVYCYPVTDYGAHRYTLYDVTDYEGPSCPTHKSLLYYLTDMDEQQLCRAQRCNALSSEPFNTWCHVKIQSHKRSVAGLIIFWLLFVFIYYMKLVIVFNSTHPGAGMPVDVILCSFAIFILLLEILHIKTNIREMWQSCKNMFVLRRVPVTFTFAYRVFQIVFSISVIVSMIMFGVGCYAPGFIQSVNVLSVLSSSLSLLFFLQLGSSTGHLLIVSQKMISESVVFFLMISVMYTGFATAFFILHQPPFDLRCHKDYDWVNEAMSNSTDSPTAMFNNFSTSLYETLLLMFVVMAPLDIHFSDAAAPWLAIIVYILLLCIIGIVFLNLLIALMTRRMQEIHAFKEDILKLERLSIVLYVEQRIQNTWLGKKVLHFAHKTICCKKRPSKVCPDNTGALPDDRVFLEVLECVVEDGQQTE